MLYTRYSIINPFILPGLFSGILSVILISLTNTVTFDNYVLPFSNNGKTNGEQAGYQAIGIAISLGIGSVTGIIIGFIIKAIKNKSLGP